MIRFQRTLDELVQLTATELQLFCHSRKQLVAVLTDAVADESSEASPSPVNQEPEHPMVGLILNKSLLFRSAPTIFFEG